MPEADFVGEVAQRVIGQMRPHGRHAAVLSDDDLDKLLTFGREPQRRWSAIRNGTAQGISSLEIALLAEALSVEPHWLITGEPDPRGMTLLRRGCPYPFDD